VVLFPRRALARLICAATAASTTFSLGSALGASATPVSEAQARKIGTDAYVYGTALMEFLRQRATQTSVTVPTRLSDAPINQLGNQRSLADAAHQVFVAPNNDTLYTMGHLDLSKGPLVLHVPKVSHHRYYVMEFIDPYTNDFHYVGSRTTGDGTHNFVIVGPHYHGTLPGGLRVIRSSYDRIWICGRTLVYGPSDLPAVHKIQAGYKLIPLGAFERVGLNYTAPRPKRVITSHTNATIPTGIRFFDALGTAMAQNPPSARDAAILRELRTVGIGPGLHPSIERLPAGVIAGLRAAAAGGPAKIVAIRARIVLGSAPEHHGWYVAPSDIGNYGTDYDLRAVVAVYGIAANIPAEALYPVGTFDNTGQLLNGAHRYMIHIAAGQLPPVRAYWSFTAYNPNLYLVSNPINRYAINQFTPGVKYNKDGSLDIYMQSSAPAGHRSNWLPSPPSGQFEVILRMYWPKAGVLNGSYSYPQIIRVG
jgi:hypothetical protein